MPSVQLSIPGKTFFAGEYLALEGGPALVAGTKPRFVLKVEKGSGQNPFHPDSPAGLFYQAHEDYFSRFQLEFSDPYQGEGGFGASSAQFALLHALYQLQEEVWGESERFYDLHELLKDYRELHKGSGFPPSGADVVGQCRGGLTYFDRNNGKVQTFAWPFHDAGFYIFSTGRKVPTHEHLKKVHSIPVSRMEAPLKEIHSGLSEVNFSEFIHGLEDFARILTEQKWVADHSIEFVKQIRGLKGVLFAKGCGALGADVILVIYSKKDSSQDLVTQISNLGLKFRGDESSLDAGLKVEGFQAGIKSSRDVEHG